MDGCPFDINEGKTVSAKEIIQRCHRKIAQVLVIDSIEFAFFNKIYKIWAFDHSDARLPEQDFETFNETV